jgi:LysR family transcriptional activator of dmlA
MKIRDISIWEGFLQVAKERNFAAAARSLKIGAPLLTKKIQMLENELGVRLFNRTTRSVQLTQEGIALIPKVKSILEEVENIENQFESTQELNGTIRISCVTAYAYRVLSEQLVQFQKLHPKVHFDLDASDRYIDLIDSNVDIAIRADEPHGADYVYKKLVENNLVVCASPDFLLKSKAKVKHPADLKKYPLLTLSVYGDCKFIRTGIPLSDLFESKKINAESGLLMTHFVLNGAGIGIRSLWDVKPFLDNGTLVQLLPDHPIESFGTIYAVITSNRLLSKRVRAFLDFIVQSDSTSLKKRLVS